MSIPILDGVTGERFHGNRWLQTRNNTFNGINYADAFHNALTGIGWGLTGIGTGFIFRAVFNSELNLSVGEKRFPA